jgi:cysteine desulfurase/selenocysteine lyase
MHTARLGDRALFPELAATAYLNHAAMSPPSVAVRDAVGASLDAYARKGAGAWVAHRDQRDRLRHKLGSLVHARGEDVALVPSTSQGLVDLALCFPWRTGDRVLLLDGEFPTNVTPWQRAAATFGLDTVFLRAADFAPGGDGLDRLEAELRRGLRLVAVSAVQFQTGLRMPLRAMAQLVHRHGAEICVDAIQAVGAIPLDVNAMELDYLVAGSHKWLMGPEGCGMAWIAPARVGALRPVVAAWLSHEDSATFLFEGPGHLRYDRPIRARADFLEIGAQNTLGFVALEAAVDLLLQLGTPAIFAHVQSVLDPLERGLLALGFSSLRSPDADSRSCILGVRPPAGIPLAPVWRHLQDQGIACATPDGVLRLSPHWPNSLAEVPLVLTAAERALARTRAEPGAPPVS